MTEERNGLPELSLGWEWTTVGEVVAFEYGKGLRKDRRDPSGKIPVYGSNGIVGHHSTLLVEAPCLIVGRKGTAGQVHISNGPCWPIDTTYYVIPPEGIDVSFLYYLLSTLRLGSFDRSTAIPGFNRDDAYALPIPLPPLPEQHRIVAKIEELFTQLDAGVVALEKAKTQLRRYRQAVLKAAVEGELTREWREAHRGELEPASVLVERILEERWAKWEAKHPGKRYKLPTPPETDDLPELPEGWGWATVEQVAENFDSMRVPVKAADRQKMQGPYPYYGASGIIDHVNDYLFDGDFLLVAEDGANLLARSTPISFQARGKFWVNNHAHVLKTLAGCPLGYLETFFNVTDLKFCITGSAQPKLTQRNLNKIPVPLPPLTEQWRIVAEVEQRLSVIDEMEKAVEQGLKRAERLRQSILKRAFEGKLVPQDPSDEPASVLLERIKAEKGRREVEGKEKGKHKGSRKKRRKTEKAEQLRML